ncbi:MAG: hydroxymethylglutaryl-CoA lyase [Deltaproteobacteria bacterium]|nr:MAG: hydroxymethylglutaryl-CoA lyase [Deltaproteobacteria bacterium]
MILPHSVAIEDVTLRDGLQSESRLFSLPEKLEIAHGLIDSGVKHLQVGALVHPEWVPQMADTEKFFKALPQKSNISYTVLVLNGRGLERALDVGITHLYVGISASETHSQRNSHCSLSQAKHRVAALITRAKESRLHVRAGVMVAFGCPYEGFVPPSKVLEIVRLYRDLGADMIDLADTAGLANPRQIYELTTEARDVAGEIPLSLHLHDTRGMGLANLLSGLQAGVCHFDTSTGGLGGCPFIPNAAGNIATEDAVFMLNEMGIETGIDASALCAVTRRLESLLGRTLPGRMCHVE